MTLLSKLRRIAGRDNVKTKAHGKPFNVQVTVTIGNMKLKNMMVLIRAKSRREAEANAIKKIGEIQISAKARPPKKVMVPNELGINN